MKKLETCESTEEINKLADNILKQNKKVSLAYTAKALYYFDNADFENFILYKEEAIKHAPYEIEEYQDYYTKLNTALEYTHDKKDKEKIKSAITNIDTKLKQLENKTSSLAYLIDEKPIFEIAKR